jgi:hypothetical protein
VIREVDPARLRFYASLTAIAAGIAILLYVASRHLGGSPGGETAVLPDPPATLTRGRAEDCAPDWRFIDNVDQRYTVCLPLNLLYYDGVNIVPLEEMQPENWFNLFNHDFVLVNHAWFEHWPAGNMHPAFAPISLRIDVVPPGVGFDGCDLRGQPVGEDGIAICTDRLDMDLDQAVFRPEGKTHRFRALVPTLPGRAVNEVFSLYLSINSLSADWPTQEPFLRQILASLRPY